MNKFNHSYLNLKLLFMVFVLFFSCKRNTNLVRQANGKVNTIAVIIDDQLWSGEVGDLIRNKFASPVVGLPQEEPLFTINQYPAKLMEGFVTDSRAILVIKKENKTAFEINQNKNVKRQNVFHISGKTITEILEILEQQTPKIIQIIKENEIIESQRIHKLSLVNTYNIKNRFKIDLQIPSGYLYVLKSEKFIWLKKEITNGNTSLLIYELPSSVAKDSFINVENIVKLRDSIGHLYIKGTEPDSQMITEEGYAPYFSKSKIKNRTAFETKGTWELKNDFMSGPFINYAIPDISKNRILVLEGFCYLPSKEKRDLIHELEAIIKSIRWIKNKN